MSEELVKWLLIGTASGYVPLGIFIYYLVKALIKSKDECVAVTRESLIQNRELTDLLGKVSNVTEKVLLFLWNLGEQEEGDEDEDEDETGGRRRSRERG